LPTPDSSIILLNPKSETTASFSADKRTFRVARSLCTISAAIKRRRRKLRCEISKKKKKKNDYNSNLNLEN
jgi:hypothetical protein